MIGLLSWVDTQGRMRLLSPAIMRSGKGVLLPKHEPTKDSVAALEDNNSEPGVFLTCKEKIAPKTGLRKGGQSGLEDGGNLLRK